MAEPQASTNDALAPIPEQHCVTAMKKFTFKYSWTISDFRSLLSTFPQDLKLDSPIFSDPENNFKFRLQISPKYQHNGGNGYEDHVAMYLKSENERNVLAGCSMYIVNSLGQPTNTNTCKPANISRQRCVGFDHYVPVSTLTSDADHELPGGNITISCEVTVLNAVHNVVEDSFTSKDTSLVLRDLNTMYESMKFSDVILKVQGKEFPAHKIFLASRSEVFAAMLEHNMEESQLNVVAIKDMEPETLQELLRFVYTGKVCNMGKVALELLVAADTYALHNLKTMCENSLKASLCVQNACEILQIAYLHSANSIKELTIKFIHNNARKVFETNSWKSMILNHPKLVSELYSSLYNI